MEPILEPNPPKTDQDEPKRAIRSCKEPKNCIYKKVVFAWNCQHFLTLKASQESLKKPKRLPRDTQGAPKPPKQNIKNWTQKVTNFRQFLQPLGTPKLILKLMQKRQHFWHPLPPHLQSPNNAPPKIKREG